MLIERDCKQEGEERGSSPIDILTGNTDLSVSDPSGAQFSR
jgi:hypothetical protein